MANIATVRIIAIMNLEDEKDFDDFIKSTTPALIKNHVDRIQEENKVFKTYTSSCRRSLETDAFEFLLEFKNAEYYLLSEENGSSLYQSVESFETEDDNDNEITVFGEVERHNSVIEMWEHFRGDLPSEIIDNEIQAELTWQEESEENNEE